MSPPINLRKFSGLIPRVPLTDLPINAAAVAENIDFGYNELRSLRGDFKLRDLTLAARSVFSVDGLRFYVWPEDVDAVISPLQNGPASDRLYYTTGNDFRLTPISLATIGGAPPSTSFRVGVPRPSTPPRINVEHPAAPKGPIATVEATPADTYQARLTAAQLAADTTFKSSVVTGTENRTYTYAYANVYQEQGPPSEAAMIEVKAITVAGVTTYSKVTVEVAFDGTGDYVPITGARLYRQGGSSEEYFFVKMISGTEGKVQTVDTTGAGALNEVLESENAYPPSPQLTGLFNIGNGILCAWKGRELWFSDAYRPWSWPPAYMITVPHTIVGAHLHAAGALVTTVAEPSLISGVSPDAMAEIPLDIAHAGASKWSVISIAGRALYACHDGIVAVEGSSPSMALSDRFFTREVWRDRCGAGLASMQFARYDGKLIVFSKAGAFVPFMLDLSEGGEMTDLPQFVASTASVLTTSDQMYVVSGTTLRQFGGGSMLPLRWATGDIVLAAPAALAVVQVECTGDFTIRFYQKDKLGYTKTVESGETIFYLPTEPRDGHAGLESSDRWKFEISGTGRFKRLRAASSIRGLKDI